MISFFNSRTLKNKRVAFGAARAFDQSAGIVTRNTNSWSGNECFNNANSPPLSLSLHPSIPLPRRPPPHPPPEPGHGSQNLFSSADRCNFALSWQRRVHRSSDVSRPPHLPPALLLPRAYALSSICSQLFPAKLFAFQSAPFCRAAPSICPVKCGARFRDMPNFRRMPSAEGEKGGAPVSIYDGFRD